MVTAIDCVNHVRSSAELIGLFQSLKFKLVMSMDNGMSCDTWITSDLVRKISDVEHYLVSACDGERSISCIANSQFSCGSDPTIATYEWVWIIAMSLWTRGFTCHTIHVFRTFLVSTESLSSGQQLDCLREWINSNSEIEIAGEPVQVRM